MQHRIHRSWGIFCCIVNECARILCGLAFKCRLAVACTFLSFSLPSSRLAPPLSLPLSLSLARSLALAVALSPTRSSGSSGRERERERKRDPCAAQSRTREGRFPSVASPLACVSLECIFFRSAGSLALDCKRSEFGDAGWTEGGWEGGRKGKKNMRIILATRGVALWSLTRICRNVHVILQLLGGETRHAASRCLSVSLRMQSDARMRLDDLRSGDPNLLWITCEIVCANEIYSSWRILGIVVS